MKKLVMLAVFFILTSCSSEPNKAPQSLQLTPPETTEVGFLRMSKKAYYYVDINSVWVDSETRHLIHFDAVINLTKAVVLNKNKKTLAQSLRQAKTLNCKNLELTHLKTDYYTEFWGRGIGLTPVKQYKRQVTLRKGSSLHTLGEVLCVNLYREK